MVFRDIKTWEIKMRPHPSTLALLLLLAPSPSSCSQSGCEWRRDDVNDDDNVNDDVDVNVDGIPLSTVDCRLRVLDFRRNSTDGVLAAVLQRRRASRGDQMRSLNVECSGAFFFESQLRSDHFGSLPSLEELTVRKCKIRTLPPRAFVGLTSLKSLSLHTSSAPSDDDDDAEATTSSSPSSPALTPDYESLVGLDALSALDLSLNRLSRLPQGLLCPLKQLKTLNLSSNAFVSLQDLKMVETEDCQLSVTTLVLSRNHLSSLTPGSLPPSLTALDLSRNRLSVLVPDALRGLKRLTSLDLSQNRLASLPPGLLHRAAALQVLRVRSNALGNLEPGAFARLAELRQLDLSANRLDENWVRPGLFRGLRNLLSLDLSGNHIARIDDGLFADLERLQVLDLSSNALRTLSATALSSQPSLTALLLSRNRLETLHQHSLSALPELRSLALDHNKLQSIHPRALRNCSRVEDVSLAGNLFTQVPEAVTQLASLTTLDVSSNLIGVLTPSSLRGLPALTGLKAGSNELSRVDEGAFGEARQIRHLDLGGNRFTKMEQSTFASLESLESLNLAENQLEDINGLLQAQVGLKWLNVSQNALQWFDYAFVPPSVEWLDVAGNAIDALGNYYGLMEQHSRLRYLDASRNRISELGPQAVLPGTQHLFLADNLVEKIEPDTFVGKYALRQVHLQRNRLTALDSDAVVVTPQKKPPVFYLEGNPFVCDCHLQWFKRLSPRAESPSPPPSPSAVQLPLVADLHRVRCSVLRGRDGEVAARDLARVRDEQFLCRYEQRCLPGCRCCDFLACDCQSKCPQGCDCFRNQNWLENVVQCSAGGFTTTPEVVPMDVTVLYLDGNNLTELTPGVLVGRNRLRHLSVNNSQVETISNQSFAGLFDLQILHLGHNKLKRLHGHEFAGLLALRELHLQHNQLVSMAPETFKPLRRLAVLRLDGNLLISFPIWQLSSNPALQSLTLSDNWWQCDCDFVRKFRMFIDGNVDIIPDAGAITCTSPPSDGDGNGQLAECSGFLSGSPGSAVNIAAFDDGGAGGGGHITAIVVVVTAVSTVATVMLLVLIRSRESILVWMHATRGVRIHSTGCCVAKRRRRRRQVPEDEDLFDALVLYSAKDDGLVRDELCRQLEPQGLRLCLLHRDLSGIYTSEAFKSAVAASQRVVLLFSHAFFACGEWEYVRELGLNERDCLVLLTPGLDSGDVKEATALDLMRKCRRTLTWGKEGFWRRLRYHLPDPTAADVREGGAELDVSGAWTFSNADNDGDASANVASSAKLLDGGGDGSSNLVAPPSLTPILNGVLPPSSPPPHLRARKQPHQCSTHYLAGAPPPASASASPLHQRSRSAVAATRSCGTATEPKVVINFYRHERSASANNKAASTPVAHFRTSSQQVPALARDAIPPTPPPKRRLQHSFYNMQQIPPTPQHQPPTESLYSSPCRPSILSRLMTSSQHQLAPPPPPPPPALARPAPVGQEGLADKASSSLALIPLRCAAESSNSSRASSSPVAAVVCGHHRSFSYLDRSNVAIRKTEDEGLFHHARSASHLAPARQRVLSGGVGGVKRSPHHQPVARTASMLIAPPTTANGNFRHAPYRNSLFPTTFSNRGSALDLMAREELLKASAATSPLVAAVGNQCHHSRSKSTPHKGFVL